MGERDAEPYEDLKTYAQAIKGDEAFAQRKKWGQSWLMVLSETMARPLRVEVAGGLYHVIVRGNERKSVSGDDADREWYLARLASYRERFGFRLLAYCLMDNHVHLALETGKGPLSRIMACLQSSYTQYFNRRLWARRPFVPGEVQGIPGREGPVCAGAAAVHPREPGEGGSGGDGSGISVV